MEEVYIQLHIICRFAGIELISDRTLDETTILTFRHLLEKHGLGEHIFDTFKAVLAARGVTLHQGAILDATLIPAPSSITSKDGKRASEMHWTTIGKQLYFR